MFPYQEYEAVKLQKRNCCQEMSIIIIIIIFRLIR